MNTDRFKFRVWDAYSNAFRDDFHIQSGGKITLYNSPKTPDITQHPKRFVIEQCTGVRDKNGKLIYEGDVVNAQWGPNVIQQAKIERKSSGAFVLNDGKRPIITVDEPHYIEIVGNVHENGGDNGKTD